MAGSTLPPAAAKASEAALEAAIADSSSETQATDAPTGEEGDVASPTSGEGEEPQVVELGEAPKDEDRTIFEDPKTFNVKHPLYSSWTLWYESPKTKARDAPPTPMSVVPPTPSASAAQSWMDDIKKVITFDSVEEFWGLYNNIIPPSELGSKANYYLFKEGIIPAWEDAANQAGGKWSIQLPRDKNREHINQMWLYTMLAAIGETFDPALSSAVAAKAEGIEPPKSAVRSIITGVIVSARPTFYRVSIWTRLAPSNAATAPTPETDASEYGDGLYKRIEFIGKHFKTSILNYPEGARLAGNLSTDVEFVSHKDSEKKSKSSKKWTV